MKQCVQTAMIAAALCGPTAATAVADVILAPSTVLKSQAVGVRSEKYPMGSLAASPYVETNTATTNGATSTTTYDLTQTDLRFTFDHARDGTQYNFADSYSIVTFQVTTNSTYAASGQYVADDATSAGRTRFDGHLLDKTTNTYLYRAQQESLNTVDQTFVFGGTAGDNVNLFSGSLSGALVAGRTYELFHQAFTFASPDADGGSTASGRFDFAIVAVPEPAGLSLLALGGVALLRRRRA